MPTQQTPASRRFVPPSSTSIARSSQRPGLSARFVHPSQPASSPFTRTPFSSTPAKGKGDDIDVDDDSDDADGFDDDSTQQQPGRNNVAIEDDDHSLGVSPWREADKAQMKTSMPPTQSTLQRPHTTTKRRKVSHFTDDIDNLDEQQDLSSSPPATAPQPADLMPEHDVQIQIPHSSPTPTAHEAGTDHPHSRTDSDSSDPEDVDFAPSPPKPLTTPTHRNSRFRHNPPPNPASLQPRPDQHHPYPSFQSRLLASTTSPFRGPPPVHRLHAA